MNDEMNTDGKDNGWGETLKFWGSIMLVILMVMFLLLMLVYGAIFKADCGFFRFFLGLCH